MIKDKVFSLTFGIIFIAGLFYCGITQAQGIWRPAYGVDDQFTILVPDVLNHRADSLYLSEHAIKFHTYWTHYVKNDDKISIVINHWLNPYDLDQEYADSTSYQMLDSTANFIATLIDGERIYTAKDLRDGLPILRMSFIDEQTSKNTRVLLIRGINTYYMLRLVSTIDHHMGTDIGKITESFRVNE